MKKTEKHEETEKHEKTGPPRNTAYTSKNLCFSITRRTNINKNVKKWEGKKHEKVRFGARFGRAKVIQNGDFFKT